MILIFHSILVLFCLFLTHLEGFPSSVFWTNCTTEVYPTGTVHLEVDNYFTLFDARGDNPFLPPAYACEVGLFTWKNLKAEGGVDMFGGLKNPLYFNFGVAIEEDILFRHAPSMKVGLFGFGTESRGPFPTNQNVIDFIIGKDLPNPIGGSLYVGVYSGSRALGFEKQGWMVGYKRFFCPAKDCYGIDYFKWGLAADYASGKNLIGGGGVGIRYNFTSYSGILMGPIFFNSKRLYGNWKWSVQIGIDIPVIKCYCPTAS